MAKIKLGNRPKHFKKIVKVPMLEGGDGVIEVSYIYRTRTEFGQFIDSMMDAAGVKPESATDVDQKFSLEEALAKTRDTNADYIMKVVDGWDIDAEFNRENVAQLCDELPGAALEIMNSYRVAVSEGRLGN